MNHKSSEVTQDQTSPRAVPVLSSANLREYSTRELSLLFLLLVLFTRLVLALVYSSRELSLPLLVLMLCTVLAIALVYSPIKLPLPLLLLVLATLLALALVLFFALRSLSLLTLSEQVELLKLGADLAWRQLRPNPLFHTGWHASCILVVVICASNGCPQWMPSLVRDSPLADRSLDRLKASETPARRHARLLEVRSIVCAAAALYATMPVFLSRRRCGCAAVSRSLIEATDCSTAARTPACSSVFIQH